MTIPLPTRFLHYHILLHLVWGALCLTFFLYIYTEERTQAEDFAREAARESVRKDLLYRRWNAGHGGVYVPVTPATPPNPYLAQLPDRDLVTADGRHLTCINPAYMTRQVHELETDSYGNRGHITSLRPLRPQNAPDPWEAAALRRFEDGEREISEVVIRDQQPLMRVMVPLQTEERCLTCHASQGYKRGDIRGGLSVSVPMNRYLQIMSAQQWQKGLGLLGIWGCGAVLLAITGRRLKNYVTRETENHRQLAGSERRYRELVDSIDGIVWELDLETFSFTFVSKQAESLLGYPIAAWLKPHFWSEHLHPDDQYWALHYCLERTERGENHTFEYRMLARDGRTVWLRDIVTVAMIADRPTALRGVMIDITEVKAAESQLQEYRKAVESSFDMICTADREFRYVLVNQAFLDRTGKTRSELIGQSIAEVFGQEVFDEVRPYYEQCLSGATVSFEMARHFPGLGQRWLLCIYAPISEKGTVTRIVAILRDITDSKKVEQNLIAARQLAEDANRMKSEFLANMSHELRTPLNGILGMVQLLAAGELSPEQQEYVEIARKSGWNLLELLNDLLDLSRIEAGQLHLQPREFDLPALVAGLQMTFAVQIAEQGLEFSATIDADVPGRVIGDDTRLRQILLNLIGNAVKFTAAHGKIDCRVRVVDATSDSQTLLEFVVSDTGIGIAPELLHKVYEPFVQGENVYRKRYQGAGLGLAIVRNLLTVMNGTILIDSTPGQGTAVMVRLPFAVGTGVPPAVVHTAATFHNEQPAPLRLLVAEDNPSSRLALELMLQHLGHTVVLASDGREALRHLATSDFDAVLMDIQMPAMDGMEAVRIIRRGHHGVRNPDLPVIAMTAYAMPGDRETFLAGGMTDYLAKPVFEGDLIRCLAQVSAACSTHA